MTDIFDRMAEAAGRELNNYVDDVARKTAREQNDPLRPVQYQGNGLFSTQGGGQLQLGQRAFNIRVGGITPSSVQGLFTSADSRPSVVPRRNRRRRVPEIVGAAYAFPWFFFLDGAGTQVYTDPDFNLWLPGALPGEEIGTESFYSTVDETEESILDLVYRQLVEEEPSTSLDYPEFLIFQNLFPPPTRVGQGLFAHRVYNFVGGTADIPVGYTQFIPSGSSIISDDNYYHERITWTFFHSVDLTSLGPFLEPLGWPVGSYLFSYNLSHIRNVLVQATPYTFEPVTLGLLQKTSEDLLFTYEMYVFVNGDVLDFVAGQVALYVEGKREETEVVLSTAPFVNPGFWATVGGAEVTANRNERILVEYIGMNQTTQDINLGGDIGVTGRALFETTIYIHSITDSFGNTVDMDNLPNIP